MSSIYKCLCPIICIIQYRYLYAIQYVARAALEHPKTLKSLQRHSHNRAAAWFTPLINIILTSGRITEERAHFQQLEFFFFIF